MSDRRGGSPEGERPMAYDLPGGYRDAGGRMGEEGGGYHPDGGYSHLDDGHHLDDEYDYDDGRDEAGHEDPEAWPVVDAPPRPPRRPADSRRRRHPILTALVILILVLVLLAGGGLWWASDQIDPGGHPGPPVAVVIPQGSSTSQIGSRLAAAGVIHSGTLFALYVRIHGDGPLYPGSYTLDKNLSYSAAISALEAGPKILTDKLVIPEGFSVAQIARAVAALPGLGLSAQKLMADASSGAVRSPYEPNGVNNLEGLLFPATYEVQKGETEIDVLTQMVQAFNDQASTLGLVADAHALGYTPYQVITVASIVEREAKLPGDRADVASAIYNRLHVNMPLGADSTQTYYLRLTNPTLEPTVAQLNQPSPYNTRLNAGLPPTPIANPGLASLRAAAAPATTTYLYFVEINPDGQLGFASTSAGFNQLTQQCRAAGLC